jgi:Coenzyme PQQ synthesis protein D (PqqD)
MARAPRQPPDLREARARVPAHVVHRSLAHETVVLNLKTGRYHGLNPTAGRMLSELERGDPLHEVAARLATVYDVPVEELESDLHELCLDLVERDLIELLDANGLLLATAATGDAA